MILIWACISLLFVLYLINMVMRKKIEDRLDKIEDELWIEE